MPSSITTQALVAAFAFGVIVNAATTSLFLFTKDHGWHSFRDGPRLVLIVFLAGAALWALTDFIAMTVDGNAMPGCQIATSFISGFDQIARVALIQFLVWGTQNGTKTTGQKFIFQGLVLLRFLVGSIIVGMTRPQVNSMYCVGTALVKPLTMAGIMFDGFMAFMLLVKVFIQGSFKAVPEGGHSIVRRKVLIFGIISFAIWTALSGPMLLGYDSLILITRTLLPAIGAGLVIAVLAFNHAHLSFAPQRAASAEQGGPFSGGARHARDPASQDSGYNSDTYAPPSRYEEIKGETVVRIDAFGQNTRSNRAFNHTKAPSVGQIGRPHLQQGPAGVGFDHQSTFAPSRQAPAPVQAPRVLPKKGGKIQISAPVLLAHAETGQNPLTRIATIDLATAARNEKERRDMPAQPLASNHLAPGQGGKAPLSPNSLMKNPGSVKRKQIAKSTDQSVPSEPLLDPAEMVTATSSQLSPGVEELRRRSPRHAPEGSLSTTGALSPLVPPKSTRRSQHALSALTASDLKTRPSSTLPLTPPPKSPKRTQPPLSPFGRTTSLESPAPAVPGQRGSVKVVIKPTLNAEKLVSPAVPPKDFTVASIRPMNGLPRNPRMAAAKPITADQKTPKSQTVMLLKNIEYDDPAVVHEIVNGAGKQPTTKRVASVVHRPRPIPRQSAMDRQIFPAEGSPSPKHSHKRSLSGGSGISRKSILQSVPTSPSKLPPLPPVPQTAGQAGRPLPNDTRSMTFDEKMEIFYSNAGEQPAKEMRRRSSSVPELPELPAAFRERSRSRSQSGDALRDSTHHTDKSSRSSIRTASLLDFPEVPVQRSKVAPVSKFSVDTTVGEGMMWATTTKARLESIKRQSSPVLPIEALKSPSNGSELKSHDDDTTTLWGSIHSPVKSTVIQKASAIEVPPVPKIGKCPEADANGLDGIFKVKPSDTKTDESHVMMTVVLDTSDQASPVANQGVSADLNRVLEADSRPVSWHRRIGDECPMFSGRQDSIKRRKNPPPAPLPLTRTADRRPRLVQAPEASPLEAPEKALEAIQEQLRKFEDPNRESTGSQQLQRMTLLANLEAEMGMHENQWQQMQSRLDRDSFSTTVGSPRKRESRPDSLAVSIVAQADDRSQRPERRTSRSSKSLSQNKRISSDASYSAYNAENEHEWDEDLAEAQAEYLKHRFQLVSHLSEKTTSMLVSSPQETAPVVQPPRQTSHKDEIVVLMALGHRSSQQLWQPVKGATATLLSSTPSLWSGTGSATTVDMTFTVMEQPEPLRRNLGRAIKPLTIESDRLWTKKQKRGSFGPQKGLWASTKIARPVSTTSISDSTPQVPSTPSKTLARKPSRRSKRVTLLPDILENPEPMPDKRGTLAIYQFPWGEKSDSASIRPRPQMFMAMPGTMTSGRSSQQAQQFQQAVPQLTNPFAFDAENYSASFFDDEDEGDNFPESQALSDEEDRYDDEEEDEDSDEFDETTLWEIASLLKSNQVPSRESLLPEDWRYTAEPAQIDYSEPVKVFSGDTSRSVNNQDMSTTSAVTTSSESAQSSLWSSQQSLVSSQDSVFVANPDEHTWQGYEAGMPVAVRAPTRMAQPDNVESDSLWMAEPQVATANATLLWAPKRAELVVGGLWAQQPRVQQVSKSLANPTEETWAAYQVGTAGIVRASTRSSQPTTIESTSLWQPIKSEVTMTGLWAQQPSVPTVPQGLADPSQEVWASYNVGLMVATRAPTRPSQTSTIESTSMWKTASATAKTTASGLWTTEIPKPSTQLWSVPSPKEAAPAPGLAQPSTWASYNVELIGATRAPTRPSQTSTIESTAMWKVISDVQETVTSGLWTTKMSDSSTQLWSAPEPSESTPTTGLAQPSTPSWMTYTSTTLSPVRAKPRLDNVAGPVAGLASSALWDNDHPSPVRDDWITLSTVRARSPSTSSVESAASDASSIKSNTTKASTVASIFSSFWRRKRGVSDAKSDDSVPEVPEVPSLPVVAEKQEAAPAAPKVVSVPIQAAPVVPLRRQYRPNVAFRVDWDAALQEAIAASKPKPPKRQRPTATPADWTAALAAANPRASPIIKTSETSSTHLWASTALKSPLPTTTSLWASHLTRAPRTAFPADCSMLPNSTRRGRSGSVLQQDGLSATMEAELQVPQGLTEQSLWRRSVAMEKAEVRTRDWLATESN